MIRTSMPSSFARATPSTRDILAGLCAADARHDAALQLSGAAEAQAERSGLKRGSAANAFLLRSIEQSRSALGAAAADALSEGKGMGFAEAVRRAAQLLSTNAAASGRRRHRVPLG